MMPKPLKEFRVEATTVMTMQNKSKNNLRSALENMLAALFGSTNVWTRKAIVCTHGGVQGRKVVL